MPILEHFFTKIYWITLLVYPLIFLVGICWYSLNPTDRKTVNLWLHANNLVLALCVLPGLFISAQQESQVYSRFYCGYMQIRPSVEILLIMINMILAPAFLFQFFWLKLYRENLFFTGFCTFLCVVMTIYSFFKGTSVSVWAYIDHQSEINLLSSLLEHAFLAELFFLIIFLTVYRVIKYRQHGA